jgi:DNA-binding transcriptional MerR regulator
VSVGAGEDIGTMARARTATKSDAAFRTISEVSDHLQVPQHVLRFWETKFDQVQPMKRGGGRRYYRPEDIELLRQIRDCLYAEGYTIKGVQKLLREGQIRAGHGHGGTNSRRQTPATSSGVGGAQQSARATSPSAATTTTDAPDVAAHGTVGNGESVTSADRAVLNEVLRELEDARAELARRTPARKTNN